jgi:hypothetical protein
VPGKNSREVKAATKTGIGRDLFDALVCKEQLLCRQFHPLFLDILPWGLTYAFAKTAGKVVHIHVAYLCKLAAQQPGRDVRLDVVDSWEDWFEDGGELQAALQLLRRDAVQVQCQSFVDDGLRTEL